MDELEARDANSSNVDSVVEDLQKEKDDIVRGFIREKEIIEAIHQEELAILRTTFEEEKNLMRDEFESEKKNLLLDNQQDRREILSHEKQRELEENTKDKWVQEIESLEESQRSEKRKTKAEHEKIIAEKNSEIEEIFRKNCMLRSQAKPESFEAEVQRNILGSEIKSLKEEHELEIRKLSEEYQFEKSEMEREHTRDKAELVKKLSVETDKYRTDAELKATQTEQQHQAEMREKIEIVERLWEERNQNEKKRMNNRFQREIKSQREKFNEELNAQLLEKESAIKALERENKELIKELQMERFGLAKVYNREMSLLARLDSPSKEDVEVALIDEVAKLRDEHQKAVENMEKRNKKKLKELKKAQQPLTEAEEQHRNEIEVLKNKYETEKEEFEAQLRNEQLHLLKSFEFEKSDTERFYKKLIEERENEFEIEVSEMKSSYEKEIEEIMARTGEAAMLKEQLSEEKQRNEDLFDKVQELEKQNSRRKEGLEKDRSGKRDVKEQKSSDQDLEQTVEELTRSNENLTEQLHRQNIKCEQLLEEIRKLERDEAKAETISKEKEDPVEGEMHKSLSDNNAVILTEGKVNKKNEKQQQQDPRKNDSEEITRGSADEEDGKDERHSQESICDQLTIKSLQNALDKKDVEFKQLKDQFQNEKSEMNERLQGLRDVLDEVTNDYDGEEKQQSLEDLKERDQKLVDAVNQHILALDNISDSTDGVGANSLENTGNISVTKLKSFAEEVEALVDLLDGNDVAIEKNTKELLNERIRTVKKSVMRSHELEKLEQEENHQKEKNRLLEELSNEKEKEVEISAELFKVLQEKVGISEDKCKKALEKLLLDQPSMEKPEDKVNNNLSPRSKQVSSPRSDENFEKAKSTEAEEILKQLRKEKEDLKRSVDELEEHFKKEKEEMMEKIHSQHKEFVLSPEAEIIETLLKQKSALEEAFNLERFYLSRIYYFEMKDELEDILNQRNDDMKKDFEKDKMDIVLKYNKDIADLHKILADKDELQVELLKDKNAMTRKVLSLQRRTSPDVEPMKTSEMDNLKKEAEKMETILPLQKEISDLQRERKEEHESAVKTLETAIDLIRELLQDKPADRDSLQRKLSFVSIDNPSEGATNERTSVSSVCSSHREKDSISGRDASPKESPSGQEIREEEDQHHSQSSLDSPIPCRRLLLPDYEIHTREDLKKALEDLVENVLNEDEECELESSSGASSDLESGLSTPAPESTEDMEGIDSGAESAESDELAIKKSQLNLALNLERFSLGRLYYNEYKDSLRKAVRKLAKAKDSLKNKSQELENELLDGVRDLVSRTTFGKQISSTIEAETQTVDDFEILPLETDKDVGIERHKPEEISPDKATEKQKFVDDKQEDKRESVRNLEEKQYFKDEGKKMEEDAGEITDTNEIPTPQQTEKKGVPVKEAFMQTDDVLKHYREESNKEKPDQEVDKHDDRPHVSSLNISVKPAKGKASPRIFDEVRVPVDDVDDTDKYGAGEKEDTKDLGTDTENEGDKQDVDRAPVTEAPIALTALSQLGQQSYMPEKQKEHDDGFHHEEKGKEVQDGDAEKKGDEQVYKRAPVTEAPIALTALSQLGQQSYMPEKQKEHDDGDQHEVEIKEDQDGDAEKVGDEQEYKRASATKPPVVMTSPEEKKEHDKAERSADDRDKKRKIQEQPLPDTYEVPPDVDKKSIGTHDKNNVHDGTQQQKVKSKDKPQETKYDEPERSAAEKKFERESMKGGDEDLSKDELPEKEDASEKVEQREPRKKGQDEDVTDGMREADEEDNEGKEHSEDPTEHPHDKNNVHDGTQQQKVKSKDKPQETKYDEPERSAAEKEFGRENMKGGDEDLSKDELPEKEDASEKVEQREPRKKGQDEDVTDGMREADEDSEGKEHSEDPIEHSKVSSSVLSRQRRDIIDKPKTVKEPEKYEKEIQDDLSEDKSEAVPQSKLYPHKDGDHKDGLLQGEASQKEGKKETDDDVVDVNNLAEENKRLNNKFNILRALVGKWFVDEIPELKQDSLKKGKVEDGQNDVDENRIAELQQEKDDLSNEIQDLTERINTLKDMSDSKVKEEERNLNEVELDSLKAFEEVEIILKTEEEKDLIQHLVKERGEVCKKREEVNVDIEAQKDKISSGDNRLQDLMTKKDELEELVAEQARQLGKKRKNLDDIHAASKEKERLDKAVEALQMQQMALKGLLQSQAADTSTQPQDDNDKLGQELVSTEPRDEEQEFDKEQKQISDQPKYLSLDDSIFSPPTANLVKARQKIDKESQKLENKIHKGEKDIDRYNRMLIDQTKRLEPFLRKKKRLEEALAEAEKNESEKKEEPLSSEHRSREETQASLSIEPTYSVLSSSEKSNDEIKERLIQIQNKIKGLSKRIPVQLQNEEHSETDVLFIGIHELEKEKDDLNVQIAQKESDIEQKGVSFGLELKELLEDKAKTEERLLDIESLLQANELSPEEIEDMPEEAKEAFKLAYFKDDVESSLQHLDNEIRKEEMYFVEAVAFQRTGKLKEGIESSIRNLLDNKDQLLQELKYITAQIVNNIDSNGNATADPTELERSIERKVEIDDEVGRIQDRIEDESVRAASALKSLLEDNLRKREEFKSLATSLEKAKEAVKSNISNNGGYLSKIPKNVIDILELKNEKHADDIDGVSQSEEKKKTRDVKTEMEKKMQGIALKIQKIRKQGRDPNNEEDELCDVISEVEILDDKLAALDIADTKNVPKLDEIKSLLAEKQDIIVQLDDKEEMINSLLSAEDDKSSTSELGELRSIIEKKLQLEKSIENMAELIRLLDEKKRLEERLQEYGEEDDEISNLRKELEEIEKRIKRKSQSIVKLEAMIDDNKNQLINLTEKVHSNKLSATDLDNAIDEATHKTQESLEEAEKEREIYKEETVKEESQLKHDISSLEDELEESREEMEFVENELEAMQADFETGYLPPELLELENMLKTKKALRDYLLEIDSKLDTCDGASQERLSSDEINALKAKRRDLEKKLQEIQEQKRKLEVDLEDDEIQETYRELCEEKDHLEAKRGDLLAQILGENVFSKLAEERTEEKPNDDEQSYYKRVLDRMVVDDKTLIKLAEENEMLRELSGKQRKAFETLVNRLTDALGEELANALSSQQSICGVSRGVLDSLGDGKETLTDILQELHNENGRVREFNEELGKDIDTLKDKVGDDLIEKLLTLEHGASDDDNDFINEVNKGEKTIEEILEEQNDALERTEEILGKNLANSILKTKEIDTSEDRPSSKFLRAPEIMTKNNYNLETVIAAYEKDLDYLGNENDLLKGKLGVDLVNALIGFGDKGQEMERKESRIDDDTVRDTAQGINKVEHEQLKFEDPSGDAPDPSQRETYMEAEAFHDKDDKTCMSYKTVKSEKETVTPVGGTLTPASPKQDENKENDILKSDKEEETFIEFKEDEEGMLQPVHSKEQLLKAPVLMAQQNKTLAAVIADYEKDLGSYKSNLGSNLSKALLEVNGYEEDEVSEENLKRTGGESDEELSDERNSSTLKSRIPVKIKKAEKETIPEDQRKIKSRIPVRKQEKEKRGDEIKAENVDREQESRTKQDRFQIQKPLKRKDDAYEFSQESQGYESKPQSEGQRLLPAIVLMAKENATLEDVIDTYEKELDILKSKLGQNLTKTLLETEKDDRDLRDTDVSDDNEASKSKDRGHAITRQEEHVSKIPIPLELEEMETDKTDAKIKKEIQEDEHIFPTTASGFEDKMEDQNVKELKEYPKDKQKRIEDETLAATYEDDATKRSLAYYKPLRAADLMARKHTTLEDVIEGYENDIDLLMTKLGPVLMQALLGKEETSRYGADETMTSFPVIELETPASVSRELEDEELKDVSLGYSSEDSQGSKELRLKRKEEVKESEKGKIAKRQAVEEKGKAIEEKVVDSEKGKEEENELKKEESAKRWEEEERDKEIEEKSVDSEKGLGRHVALKAPTLMEEHDVSLEAVITKYERDLDVLCVKLGPHLLAALLEEDSRDSEVYEIPVRSTCSTGSRPSLSESGKESWTDEETNVQFKESESDFIVHLKRSQPLSKLEKPTKYLTEKEPGSQKDRKDVFKDDSKVSAPQTEKEETIKDASETDDKEYQQKEKDARKEVEEQAPESLDVNAAYLLKSERPPLTAPLIMAMQNETLEDVIKGYESDLDILISSLGPHLAHDILAAGRNVRKMDELTEEGAAVGEKQSLDETGISVLQSKKGEQEGKIYENDQTDLIAKPEIKTERGTVTLQEAIEQEHQAIDYKTEEIEEKETKEFEYGKKEDPAYPVFVEEPLTAPGFMLQQNITLEDLINNYERELGILKSKLGPNLSKVLLEEDEKVAEPKWRTEEEDKEELNHVGKPLYENLQKTASDSKMAGPFVMKIDRKDDTKAKIIMAVSLEDGQEVIKDPDDQESHYQENDGYENVDILERKQEKHPTDIDTDQDYYCKTPVKDRGHERLAAPRLMAQQNSTLEEVIEAYENDIRILNSRLGPNLIQAILNTGDRSMLDEGKTKDPNSKLLENQTAVSLFGQTGKTREGEPEKDSRTSESKKAIPQSETAADDVQNRTKGERQISMDEKEKEQRREQLPKAKDTDETSQFDSIAESKGPVAGTYEDVERAQEIILPAAKAMVGRRDDGQEVGDHVKSHQEEEPHSLVAPSLMVQHNSTLEDVIETYEKELDVFKSKLGPGLSKALLQEDKSKSKVEYKYDEGEEEVREQELTRDAESKGPVAGTYDDVERAQEIIPPAAKAMVGRREDGQEVGDHVKSHQEEEPHSLVAPSLMVQHNSTLEDVIETYEKELDVFKSKLGPGLSKALLQEDKSKSKVEYKYDEGEEEVREQELTRDAESKGPVAGTYDDVERAQEIIPPAAKAMVGRRDDGQEFEDHAKSHQEKEPYSVVAPSLMVQHNSTLEDVIKTYEKELDVFKSKLGPGLSKALLQEDKSKSKVEYKYDKGEEEVSEQELTREDKRQDDDDTARVKVSVIERLEIGQEQIREEDVKHTDDDIIESQNISALDNLKEMKGDEMPTLVSQEVLSAPALMAQQNATLEDIIKGYENDLAIFNSSLGPNLANALLEAGKRKEREALPNKGELQEKVRDGMDDVTRSATNAESEKGADKSNQEIDVARLSEEDQNQQEIESQGSKEEGEKLKEEIDMIDEAPDFVQLLLTPVLMDQENVTLEDVIQNYERELGVLKSKLGPNLTKVILDADATRKEKEAMKDITQQEKSKAESEEGAVKSNQEIDVDNKQQEIESQGAKEQEGEKSKEEIEMIDEAPDFVQLLLTPVLMDQENVTLEDVIQNYERQLGVLKSKLGPHLTEVILDADATRKEKEAMKDITQQEKAKAESEEGAVKSNQEIDVAKLSEVDNKQQEIESQGSKEEGEKLKEEIDMIDEAPDFVQLLLTPVLMDQENVTLEDVIQNYERELGVLKSKLGPNLTKVILDADATRKEKEAMKDITQQEKSKTESEEGAVKSNQEIDVDNKQQEIESQGAKEQEGEKSKEEIEMIDEAPDFVQLLLTPVLMDQENVTLEDVIQNYERQLGVLKSKLGPHLTEVILDADATRKEREAMKDITQQEKAKAESEEGAVKRNQEIDVAKLSEVDNKQQEIESQGAKEQEGEKSKEEIENINETPNFVQLLLTEAPILMDQENVTLEDVIQNYERELGVLKSKLGPNLTKVILDADATRKQKEAMKDDITEEEKTIDDQDWEMKPPTSKLKDSLKTITAIGTDVQKAKTEADYFDDPNKDGEDVLVTGSGQERQERTDMEEIHEPGHHQYEEEIKDSLCLEAFQYLDNDSVSVENILADYETKLNILEERLGPTIFAGIIQMQTDPNGQDFERKSSTIDEPDDDSRAEIEKMERPMTGIGVEGDDDMQVTVQKDTNFEKQKEDKAAKQLEDTERELDTVDDLDHGSKEGGDTIEKESETTGTEKDTNFKTQKEDDQEGKTFKEDMQDKSLRALEIMNDKGTTLEDVISNYEDELDKKTVSYDNEKMSEVMAIYEKELEELRQQNSAFRDRLGEDLSRCILGFTHDGFPTEEAGDNETDWTGTRDKIENVNEKKLSLRTVFKAQEIMKEDGKTLGDVMNTYERELEALSEYGRKNELLQKKNRELQTKLEDLISQIGEGLSNQLLVSEREELKTERGEEAETVKGDFISGGKEDIPTEGKPKTITIDNANKETTVEAGMHKERESEDDIADEQVCSSLEAPRIMKINNLTLEEVVENYENQLETLIRQQEENAQLKSDIDLLEMKIGPRLLSGLRMYHGKEAFVSDEVDADKSTETKQDIEVESKHDTIEPTFAALVRMENEDKTLEDVLSEYEEELERLERENNAFRKATGQDSEDGDSISDLISEYEDKIKTLEKSNKHLEQDYEEKVDHLKTRNEEIEQDYGDKMKELESEIEDLAYNFEQLSRKVREDLVNTLIGPQESEGNRQVQHPKVEAVRIMDEENKTLADVVEDYEEKIRRLDHENSVLKSVAGQSDDGTSILDTISEYEEGMENLKDINRMLNNRIDMLTEKVGKDLTKEILDVIDGDIDEQAEGDIHHRTAAVTKMEAEDLSLEDVIRCYEEQLKGADEKEVSSLQGDFDKLYRTLGEGLANEILKQKEEQENGDEEDQGASSSALDEVIRGQTTIEDVLNNHDDDLKMLRERFGKDLTFEVRQLDNNTVDDLKRENKRPFALWTMASKDKTLEDIVNEYEDMLLQYGALDFDQEKGESLATELEEADMEEDIEISIERHYGTEATFDLDENSSKLKEKVAELEKELQEEKELKTKYQKDVEDLLSDIVRLKMSKMSDDEQKEDLEKQIKEEYETKQENKRLREALEKELEENKTLDENNNEFQSQIRNMEKEIGTLEKALEDMSNKNNELEKQIEGLKQKLKEIKESFQTEKEHLINENEKDKLATIKELLHAKGEVEVKLQEQLSTNDDLEEKIQDLEEQLKALTGKRSEKEGAVKETLEDGVIARLKLRNESLKEQLDESEAVLKETIQKYQEEIKSLEKENVQVESTLKHEIDILKNKLDLEKASAERLKNDFDDILKREKDRFQDDFERDLEREKRKMKGEAEEALDELEKKEKKLKKEVEEAEEKSEGEKKEMKAVFNEEKKRLQDSFDEELRKKEEEHQKLIDELRAKLEDQMITEKAEMNIKFRSEKSEMQSRIETHIYGEELQKNIDLESDFQETLNKVLKNHSKEIEDVEQDLHNAEEKYQQQKLQLLEDFEREKQNIFIENEHERQTLESTIQNLLKEIIKLKHQRKEMRQHHRIETQGMEDLFEKEKDEIKEYMDRCRHDLLEKLRRDHEEEMASVKEKYEGMITGFQEDQLKFEMRRKELEGRLRNELFKDEESKFNNTSESEESGSEQINEVKVIRKGLEFEYEVKLSDEKRKFEETLQGLRREVGNLQEKRKIIQERVYNQESYSSERHVIEKSIANYKMEMLSKLEEEMNSRLAREKKPLEQEVKELQTENEELKHQRWEMKVQFRRERKRLEEEFEKEKDDMETTFNKEKENLRKRLEERLQKGQINKNIEVKISRSTSPIHLEHTPRLDNTTRMLKQENLSLTSENERLEMEIEHVTERLQAMETTFIETERLKAERMRRIQEQIPKKVIFSDQLASPPSVSPPSGAQDAMLHTLQEKDAQIHELLQTKQFYEAVFGELCDEAGLFELDQNQVV